MESMDNSVIMATEILKSFGTLQSELEQAKTSLKGVDENIKRLIGRDPSGMPPRVNVKRGPPPGLPQKPPRNRPYENNDEPPIKRRPNSVFNRLSDRIDYRDDLHHHQGQQKGIVSKVIVTPKELPSRQEALAAQNKDVKSKERNRRMFGALLGTLQKFQQEETKLKSKEDKRAQLEKKIEEHEIKEKEEIKKERQELFMNRKKKQAEIKMIELKMMRMEEYSTWEERQKPRMNFIITKAKPHIHFLPRKLNDTTKTLLESCKTDIEKMIDKKRQEVFMELQHIEDRMIKNYDGNKIKENPDRPEALEDEEDEQQSEKSVIKIKDETRTVTQQVDNVGNGDNRIDESDTPTVNTEPTTFMEAVEESKTEEVDNTTPKDTQQPIETVEMVEKVGIIEETLMAESTILNNP